jgi:peptide-methionine (S)-S-oxide reductase
METATFAAGSSRELEAALRAVRGVRETRVGHTEEPAYDAVEVDYDPWKVSYDDLLEVFWAQLDSESRSAIFPHTVEQHVAAEASRQSAEKRLGPVTTEIVVAGGRFRRSNPS